MCPPIWLNCSSPLSMVLLRSFTVPCPGAVCRSVPLLESTAEHRIPPHTKIGTLDDDLTRQPHTLGSRTRTHHRPRSLPQPGRAALRQVPESRHPVPSGSSKLLRRRRPGSQPGCKTSSLVSQASRRQRFGCLQVRRSCTSRQRTQYIAKHMLWQHHRLTCYPRCIRYCDYM
ncbi:hypothetical protein J3F83DRAFT_489327 [Trichoderma novae-zelandiae]